MPAYLEELSEEQRNSIYAEYNTNEEELRKSVNYLQEWLRQQPHLPEIKDEEFLKNTILLNKNRMEIAKRKLEFYLLKKTLMTQLHTNRIGFFPEFEKLLKMGQIVFPLPKLTPEGYRVMVYRLNKQPPDYRVDPEAFMKLGTIPFVMSAKTDCFKSLVFVIDYENVNPANVIELTTFLKNSKMTKIKNGHPNRIHKIYILNLPTTLRWILTFMKSLAKEKIANRIVVWEKKPEDLAEEIPKNILPSIYGGTEKSLDELREEWFSYLLQFRDWLSEHDSWRVNLSKIPEDSKCKDWKTDLVEPGLCGSFRSLNIE